MTKMLLRGNNLNSLIEDARSAVLRHDKALTEALGRIEPLLNRALQAIYLVCLWYDQHPKDWHEFLEQEEVHGNTEFEWLPAVKHLMQDTHEVSKSQLTRYAAVMSRAVDEQIGPDGFVDWLRSRRGVKGIYSEYLELLSTPSAKLTALKRQRALIEKFLGRSLDELTLAVVHKSRILKVLNLDEAELARFLAARAKE